METQLFTTEIECEIYNLGLPEGWDIDERGATIQWLLETEERRWGVKYIVVIVRSVHAAWGEGEDGGEIEKEKTFDLGEYKVINDFSGANALKNGISPMSCTIDMKKKEIGINW